MINPERFIARELSPEWFTARENGVTATTVAHASTPSGLAQVIAEIHDAPEPFTGNAFTDFGNQWEAWIIENLPHEFHLKKNEWLIAAESPLDRWMMSTPDAISADHKIIAEVKTTGHDWGDVTKIPLRYRRQVQWQLHTTGAEKCVFGWTLRVTDDGDAFTNGFFEPKWGIIYRDEKMISDLISTAQRIQLERIMLDEMKDKENGLF